MQERYCASSLYLINNIGCPNFIIAMKHPRNKSNRAKLCCLETIAGFATLFVFIRCFPRALTLVSSIALEGSIVNFEFQMFPW